METAAEKKERLDIEASRTKRLERVKAKQRDRGGIFKPAETNPLVDILLARDVSGRSPSKAKAKAKSKARVHRDDESVTKPRATSGRKSVGTVSASARVRRKSTAPSKKGRGADCDSADAVSGDEVADGSLSVRPKSRAARKSVVSASNANATVKAHRKSVASTKATKGVAADDNDGGIGGEVTEVAKPKPRASRKSIAPTGNATATSKARRKSIAKKLKDLDDEGGDSNAGIGEATTEGSKVSKIASGSKNKVTPRAGSAALLSKRFEAPKDGAKVSDENNFASIAGPSTAPARTSKRPREVVLDKDGAENDEHEADLPSPPKRAKVSSASTCAKGQAKATPITPRKVAAVRQKETARRGTKGKTRAASVDGNNESEGEGEDVEEPFASKSIFSPERAAPAKTKAAPKRGRRKKNAETDEDGEDEEGTGSNAARKGSRKEVSKAKAKGKGKKKFEPEPETRRSQFPKPGLETVFEGDSEEEEVRSKAQSEAKQPALSSSSKGSHKRRREDVIEVLVPNPDPDLHDDRDDGTQSARKRLKSSTTSSKTSIRPNVQRKEEDLKRKSSSKSKAKASSSTKARAMATKSQSETVEGAATKMVDSSSNSESKLASSSHPATDGEENKENSKQPETSSAKSAKGEESAKIATLKKPKPRPKPKSKAAAKSKSKPDWTVASKFANLPTTLMNSPLKVHDSEQDEIDFLS